MKRFFPYTSHQVVNTRQPANLKRATIIAHEIQSTLAREVRERLTRARHEIQYNTVDDDELSNLLGHGEQTRYDDAWIRSLYTAPSQSTKVEDRRWAELPILGYQFPRCNGDTGFDAEKLTSPAAFDRFCRAVLNRVANAVREALTLPSEPRTIDPTDEPNFQRFLNRLAEMLNDMFQSLPQFFGGFGQMTCEVATQESLRKLLKEEHTLRNIKVRPDFALVVTYTDELGQTRRILPLVLDCKSINSKAMAGAHFCRDHKAQNHRDRYIARLGTDDVNHLDTVWQDENFNMENNIDELDASSVTDPDDYDNHLDDIINSNRIVEAARGFYNALQQAAIPAFLHGGMTFGIAEPSGLFVNQRKNFHPSERIPTYSLEYLSTTGWLQRFARDRNNGVPVNNDSPETVPTNSLFIKHLDQNGWAFDIVCMVFNILENTLSDFKSYMEDRARLISQMDPGQDAQVNVPGYDNVILNRAVQLSSQAFKRFYEREYYDRCLDIAKNTLHRVGQSREVRRETHTFEFTKLLQDGMCVDDDDYIPSTVIRSKHSTINNGNEFVLKIFRLSNAEVEYFLNEVRALDRLNNIRGDRKYWPELYEFGYIHGPLELVNVKHADIFLYVAMEYIPSIGRARKDGRIATECKQKLEEAGVNHLDWTNRHLLVCRDAHGRYCRAIDYGMSEIMLQNGS